jgi:hypothetical protein
MSFAGPSQQQDGAAGTNSEVPTYILHAQQVAGKFSQTSTKRKGKKAADPLGVKNASPIGKSHKRSNSLNSQQVSVASGSRAPQALQRDSVLPSHIMWASEASWLSTALDQLANQRDLEKIDEEDTLAAGAKIVYFVHNDINDTNIESLLRTLGAFPTDGLKFARVCDEFKRRCSKWQGAIIGFAEVLVANNLMQWVEENAAHDFMTLSKHHRQQIWERAYDRDQADVAVAMWKPVGGVIDWGQIFGDRPSESRDEDHEKIMNVRVMLKVKSVFACEQVFQWRFNGGSLPDAELEDHRDEGVSLVS